MTNDINPSYKRSVLFESEQFEIVRCEWTKDDRSPLHSHHWSQCFSLIEEGVFENTTASGFNRTVAVFEIGQTMVTPYGTKHEIKCISKTGKTLHVYTPKMPSICKSKTFKQPLAQNLKESLDISLSENGTNWQNLNQVLNSIYEKSISTESVYFMNQLFSGVLPETLASEEIIAKTRTTMATFEASPVYSLVEMEVIQKLGELIGWKPESIDGVSVPGGSSANFMALHCARQRRFPDFKNCGLYNSKPLKIFVSQDSHYSLKKACVALGLGSNSLVTVNVDSNGRMLTSHLEEEINKCIQKSEIPLMVCATAGTTVYGAFDPIDSLSSICRKHNIWLHVDAAWGGPALFSKKIRSHFSGVELADSMTFDAHKLFRASLTSSLFLTCHPQILLQSNDVSGADYLFHDNSEVIDRGRLSWQCGRKPDIFSFWTIWKSYGTEGLGKFLDQLLHVQKQSVLWIKSQDRLKLMAEPGYLNICVQILPPADKVNEAKKWSTHVREQLKEKNLAMVNYSSDSNGVTFLRLILAHPEITLNEVQEILLWSLDIK